MPAGETLLTFSDHNADDLIGACSFDEHNAPVIEPGHCFAARRHALGAHLLQLLVALFIFTIARHLGSLRSANLRSVCTTLAA